MKKKVKKEKNNERVVWVVVSCATNNIVNIGLDKKELQKKYQCDDVIPMILKPTKLVY